MDQRKGRGVCPARAGVPRPRPQLPSWTGAGDVEKPAPEGESVGSDL